MQCDHRRLGWPGVARQGGPCCQPGATGGDKNSCSSPCRHSARLATPLCAFPGRIRAARRPSASRAFPTPTRRKSLWCAHPSPYRHSSTMYAVDAAALRICATTILADAGPGTAVVLRVRRALFFFSFAPAAASCGVRSVLPARPDRRLRKLPVSVPTANQLARCRAGHRRGGPRPGGDQRHAVRQRRQPRPPQPPVLLARRALR